MKVLINDTVGVMAAGRYMNPDAMIGLILGTGAQFRMHSKCSFDTLCARCASSQPVNTGTL